MTAIMLLCQNHSVLTKLENRKATGKNSPVEEYVSFLNDLRRVGFSSAEGISSPGSNFINLGLVLIQDNKKIYDVQYFVRNLEKFMKSLIMHSSGTPLHFIIITSRKSIDLFQGFFFNFISKSVAERIIEDRHWRWKRFHGFPGLRFSFVDIKSLTDTNQEFIMGLKNSTFGLKDNKYSEDLFYISPLFPQTFLALDKMMLLDGGDLIFYSDIKLLNDQFRNMELERRLIGAARDLSPHYRSMLKQ